MQLVRRWCGGNRGSRGPETEQEAAAPRQAIAAPAAWGFNQAVAAVAAFVRTPDAKLRARRCLETGNAGQPPDFPTTARSLAAGCECWLQLMAGKPGGRSPGGGG